MAESDWREGACVQSTLAMGEEGPSIEYLAGFFDGEGCFSCSIPKGDEIPQFFITISTTKQKEAEHFQKRFGGYVSDYNPDHPNHSEWWRWGVSGRTAKITAERLLPHLNGKAGQCTVFIEALSFKFEKSRGPRRYPDSVRREIRKYGEEVRSHNSAQRRFAEAD